MSRPAGPVAILHGSKSRADALAAILRAAGHSTTIIEPGRGSVDALVAQEPDLVVGSLSFLGPPLGEALTLARRALESELPLLLVVGREDGDVLARFQADEIVREPVDSRELALRVGALLKARAERRLLQGRIDELLALYRASWNFSLAGGAEELFGGLARQSAEMLGADKALVLTFDSERRQMTGQPPGYGLAAAQVAQVRYPVDDEARSRWNFLTNGPLLSNRPAEDQRLVPELAMGLALRSVLIVPMTRAARVTGLLLVADRKEPFGDADLRLLQAVAAEASVTVENYGLHERLKEAIARLREFDREKTEFVSVLVHDLRSPLMAIRGFAELMLEERNLDPQTRRDFLRTIVNETEALSRLAGDAALITRLESGSYDYDWSETDLHQVVDDAASAVSAGQPVIVEVPAGLPRVVADAERLRQVVGHLVSNAVKFAPAGSSVTLRVRERPREGAVIEVIDQGLGIPAEEQGRLFRKFQRVRTRDHQRVAGTGLGLYLCRLIVEGHGGRIWVESSPGSGSTFAILLPLDPRIPRAPGRVSAPAEREKPPA